MVVVWFVMDWNIYIFVVVGFYGVWGIGGKIKVLGYSWLLLFILDWNIGNVVEINIFGKDGFDLCCFDYGVVIGLLVEYWYYVIGVEG